MEKHFIKELLLTDSSDSDDEIEESHILEMICNKRGKRHRIENFVEKVVNKYTSTEFKENFRMLPATFRYILGLIRNDISSDIADKGRHTLDAKTQCLVALWYFSTPDSYSRFNIGMATAFRCVRRVASALLKLSPQFIKWPTSSDAYLESVIEGFGVMGFPNTIGIIDGTYIPIVMPKDNGLAYINRKNFPAIILQGVCDHKLCFTHCYAGDVGSVNDAKVLRNSDIWNVMTIHSAEMFPRGTHLLGDKAYPIIPALMVPYKDNGHLTEAQKNFNYRLSVPRSTIERTFGLLKRRFRCLKFLDVKNIEWVPVCIIACCTLHNICIIQNDAFPVDNEYLLDEVTIEDDFHANARTERIRRQQGQLKRDNYCNLFAAEL